MEPPSAAGRRAGHEVLNMIRDELPGARNLSVRAVSHGVLHVRDGRPVARADREVFHSSTTVVSSPVNNTDSFGIHTK